MGIGFVGAVMAGVVADSVDKQTGKPGQVRPGHAATLCALLLEDPVSPAGESRPCSPRTPRSRPLIRRCVLEKRTLSATFSYDAL